LRHLCIKCIIYQDRLGTNIGKALKKRDQQAPFRVTRASPTDCERARPAPFTRSGRHARRCILRHRGCCHGRMPPRYPVGDRGVELHYGLGGGQAVHGAARQRLAHHDPPLHWYAKTPRFEQFISQNDHFTKTGSGQT
jgi:hypothetical protein